MRILVLAIAILMFGGHAASAADDVAMLFFVKGKVDVRVGEGDWRGAQVLQRLTVGTKVRAAGGAEAGIVVLAGGERFAVAAGTTATVGQSAVAGARSLGRPAGLSASAAGKLAGARTGASPSRPVTYAKDLVLRFAGWLPAGSRTFSWAPALTCSSRTPESKAW